MKTPPLTGHLQAIRLKALQSIEKSSPSGWANVGRCGIVGAEATVTTDCFRFAVQAVNLATANGYPARLILVRLPEGELHWVAEIELDGRLFYLDVRLDGPVPRAGLKGCQWLAASSDKGLGPVTWRQILRLRKT